MSSATAAPERQQWSGQLGFVISAVGSAIGLGNIWRFPGVAYENGGGAFLIPYLIALLTAGVPILLLDYAVGHRFRGSAPLALRRVKKWLESLGWFQVMICFFIAIYYAAILAWAGSYFIYSFTEKWGDDPTSFFVSDYLQLADAPNATGVLLDTNFIAAVLVPLAIIWIVTIVVLALGVAKGIEKANIIFIPLLVIAFVILVIRAVTLPGAVDGLNALFTPDYSRLADPQVWMAAYGQIFFSLSIAFGIMITYSSYRKRKANLTTPGIVVGFGNSSFEILAGIGVFAIIGFMAHEQGITVTELSQTSSLKGTFLAFVTFPKAISQMPGAPVFGALFFASLLMAGFTSLLSILEVVSSAFQDKFGMSTRNAALWIGGICAIISLLLFGTASGLYNLDVMDAFVNNIGVVFSALLSCVALIWIHRKGKELVFHLDSLSTFRVKWVWLILVGVAAPLLLLYMFGGGLYGYITGGYDLSGYTRGFEGLWGWGAIAGCVIGAIVLTVIKWKSDPEKFVPWPTYLPVKK